MKVTSKYNIIKISCNAGETRVCRICDQKKEGDSMKDTISKMFELFDKHWALVTSGNIDDFNTMTVSWGSLGTLWSKPIVTVYIKPCRYTHQYLEANDHFTVSFYDENYRRDLGLLGSTSGRDIDKVSRTSLTPVSCGESVSFAEAKATIVCLKIYWKDFDPAVIPQDAMQRYYAAEAPHTMYIGEVEDIIFTGEEE